MIRGCFRDTGVVLLINRSPFGGVFLPLTSDVSLVASSYTLDNLRRIFRPCAPIRRGFFVPSRSREPGSRFRRCFPLNRLVGFHLCLALGMAILGAVAVGFLASDDGLGYLIWHSWQIFSIKIAFVGLAMAATLAFVLFAIVDRIAQMALPWKPEI